MARSCSTHRPDTCFADYPPPLQILLDTKRRTIHFYVVADCGVYLRIDAGSVARRRLRTVLPSQLFAASTKRNGIQSIYLTEISQEFAKVLAGSPFMSFVEIGVAPAGDRMMTGDDLDVLGTSVAGAVSADSSIGDTDRGAIISARRGWTCSNSA